VDKAAGLPYPLGPSHVIRAAAAGKLLRWSKELWH
jgi:hypothetical protein